MSKYGQFLRECRLHADVANDCYRRMRPDFTSSQFTRCMQVGNYLASTRGQSVVEDAWWLLELQREIREARRV